MDAFRYLPDATGWLGVALAAIAIAQHRGSRDPELPLFAAAGAILAVQAVFIAGVLHDTADPERMAIAAVARIAGWSVAGLCIALATPWWDRRGRAGLPSSSLGAGILSVVIVSDGLLLASPPTAPATGIAALGWVWLVMGILVWALTAIRRTWLSPRALHHGTVLAAAIVALIILGSWAADPGSVSRISAPAAWLQPIAVIFLLLAVLSMQRTETTRLRRSTDRAAEIVEGRAEIANMVAHEVRGPVTTIRGIASTAVAHYDRLSDEERRELLGLIEQESRRLLGTVDQTSTALKVDAGTLSFTMAPSPLATIVRAGVEAAAVPEDQHPVHVIAQENVVLQADASRLTEVVRQLVDNASKYSPPGAPITVRAVADDREALIEVTDQGPGIPAARRAAVFERFAGWRPSGYEEQPGNGLGLFICRGVVAEHEGDISIEDGPDGGTMLRVRLPLGGT